MSPREETSAAIQYLRERGHDIGQIFMPPDGNGMRWRIDGRACTSKDICELAAAERIKSASTTLRTVAKTRGARL